jgi:beta-lactamase superfamily II metal-dependent hydrolase
MDIMQAPHHGSRRIDVDGLMRWARPRLVVSCQGQPSARGAPAYARPGTNFCTTWEHGAIALVSRASGLTARSYRKGELELPDR